MRVVDIKKEFSKNLMTIETETERSFLWFKLKPVKRTFIANKELIGQLFQVAKSRGATKMQAMVRPAMERLLSRSKFKSVSTLVEYKL